MANIRTTVSFSEAAYRRLNELHAGLTSVGKSRTISDTLNFLLTEDFLSESRKTPSATYQVIDQKSLDLLKKQLSTDLAMSANLLLKETVSAGFQEGFRGVLDALIESRKTR